MGKKGKNRGNGRKSSRNVFIDSNNSSFFTYMNSHESSPGSKEVSSFSNIDIESSQMASSPKWELQGIPALPAPPTTTPQLSSPRSPKQVEQDEQYCSPITLNQYPSKFKFPDTGQVHLIGLLIDTFDFDTNN